LIQVLADRQPNRASLANECRRCQGFEIERATARGHECTFETVFAMNS